MGSFGIKYVEYNFAIANSLTENYFVFMDGHWTDIGRKPEGAHHEHRSTLLGLPRATICPPP